MAQPTEPTRVTYPVGELTARASVLVVESVVVGDGRPPRLAIVTDTTSIHPVDAAWPDQPADGGVMHLADGGPAIAVVDAVVAATDGERMHLGADIPVRRGTDGWTFVVAHLIEADARASAIVPGDEVVLDAEPASREALSVGHTACHLASLALNRALVDRWRTPGRTDALGAPDFDGTAIESSRIEPLGSVDRYRLNKSLRRAGFDTASLADADPAVLDALEASVNATLADWVAADAPVRIERDGDRLTDRRRWVAELPEGTASIPCGGTHARSTGALGAMRVGLAVEDAAGTPVLVMTTHAGTPD